MAPSRRQTASQQRRKAIIDAALDVFAAEGFVAARLDDIAEKAEVAKGTIYLFFKDKEHLFEQLLISAVSPVIAKVDAMTADASMPVDVMLTALFTFFQEEVLGTKKREIIRLVLTEGRRFPRIAEIYHREVVTKGLAIITRMAGKAQSRGEQASNDLVEFPHLVVAPLVLALIWESTFSKMQALDVEGLLAAHRRLLIGGGPPARKS